MEKSIHIGQVIQQKIKDKKMSTDEFADKMSKAVSTVYDLFKKKDIRTDELLKASEILEFDLFSLYSKKQYNFTDNEPSTVNEGDGINFYDVNKRIGILLQMPPASSDKILAMIAQEMASELKKSDQ